MQDTEHQLLESWDKLSPLSADPLDVSKIYQLKRSLEDKLQSLSDLDQGILDLTPEDSIETKSSKPMR